MPGTSFAMLPRVKKAVEDLMTRVVFVVSPTHSVATARAAMRQGNVRHLVVADDDDGVVGLLSDKDVSGTDEEALVGDVMSTPAFTINSAALAFEAIALMLQHRISALPVCDDGGGLAGIITTTDVLIVAYEALTEETELHAARPVEADRALLAAKLGRVRTAEHAGAMATAAAELAAFLKQRYQREEQTDGIFAQIRDEQPHRASEIAALCAEHEEILALTQALVDSNWQRARGHRATIVPPTGLETELIDAIERHEAREARLLDSSLAAT